MCYSASLGLLLEIGVRSYCVSIEKVAMGGARKFSFLDVWRDRPMWGRHFVLGFPGLCSRCFRINWVWFDLDNSIVNGLPFLPVHLSVFMWVSPGCSVCEWEGVGGSGIVGEVKAFSFFYVLGFFCVFRVRCGRGSPFVGCVGGLVVCLLVDLAAVFFGAREVFKCGLGTVGTAGASVVASVGRSSSGFV